MTNSIEALLGIGVSPQGNTQALADSLRGQQRAGQFLGLSQLAPAAKMGNQMQKEALASAQSAGQQQQTMAQQQEMKRRADRNYALQKSQHQFQQDEAARKQRQLEATKTGHKEAWKKEGMQPTQLAKDYMGNWVDANTGEQINPQDYTFVSPKDGGDKRGKASPKIIQTHQNSVVLAEKIEKLLGETEKWSDEQKAIADRPGAEIALKIGEGILGKEMMRPLEEKTFDDESVKQYRLQVAKIESAIRKALAGTAVTKYEEASSEKWSPNAQGISLEERNRRLGLMLEDLRAEIASRRTAYSNFDRDGYEDEPAQAQAAQQEGATYQAKPGWGVPRLKGSQPQATTQQPTASAATQKVTQALQVPTFPSTRNMPDAGLTQALALIGEKPMGAI